MEALWIVNGREERHPRFLGGDALVWPQTDDVALRDAVTIYRMYRKRVESVRMRLTWFFVSLTFARGPSFPLYVSCIYINIHIYYT